MAAASQGFGPVALGGSSAALAITVANPGDAPSGPLAAAITGSAAADFSLLDNGCAAGLPPGGTCGVLVQFTPGALGPRSARLDVAGAPGMVSVALEGTGAAAAQLAVMPANGALGPVPLGLSADRTFTLSNTGGLPAGVPAFAWSGATPGSFSLPTNGCTSDLAPGDACTFVARFTATAPGAHAATLTISASSGMPVIIAFSGTGTLPAQLTITPASAAYGTVFLGQTLNRTFTVGNAGGAPSGPVSVSVTGAAFAAVEDTCMAGLAPGDSCQVIVRFEPPASGGFMGTLTASAAPGGTAQAPLQGTGATVPTLSFNPGTVIFMPQQVGTLSAPRMLTVSSPADADAPVPLAFSTTSPEFPVAAGTCTGALNPLPPGQSCVAEITFAPQGAPGFKSASLVVTLTSTASQTVALSGQATSPLGLTPASHAFGSTMVGTTSAVQSFSLVNDGASPLGPVSVAVAAPFAIVGDGCTGVTLTPGGGTCSLGVRFAPTATGPAMDMLSASAGGFTVTAALDGTGTPTLPTFSPTAHDFMNHPVGMPSMDFVFIASNNASVTTGPLAGALTGGDASQFAITSDTCTGVSLPPAGSCTVAVRFQATTAGAKAAQLSLSSGGSATTASLAGTGL
jgi:hypothetical protein